MVEKIRFEAKDNHLRDVLFANKKFSVPRYQRPYAWDEDQVSELWNDIIGKEESPFIGSLIFNYEPLRETGCIDIIDGQQRLLSITIFIAVLRDIARTIDEEKARLYHRQDIAIEDRSGGESFRMSCGDSTADFFQKYIQTVGNDIFNSSPKAKEESRIKRNYEFLYEKVLSELEKFDQRSLKLTYLDKLREKVANLLIIEIKIENEEEAYEIFETTNARGVDLSVADLLKNLIFQKIKEKDGRDLAKEIWQDIVAYVQETNTEMKKFIRYFWISRYDFVTEKKLFRAIKREIVDWERLLNDLWVNAEIFNKLLEGGEEDWRDIDNGDKIYESIFALRLMGVSQCYVLLLSIIRNLKKLGTDPTRLVQFIEKFTFQYAVICKLPGNVVEKVYSKYALKIEETIAQEPQKKIAGRIQSIFSELEKELKSERPPFELFKASFVDFEYRNSEKNRMLVKYFLGKINSLYMKTRETKIDYNNVNIEHVLPQKPHRDWGLSVKDIKSYVDKLGNLTLVDKKINSRVQNKPINEKIGELKNSSLPVTIELVDKLVKNNCRWDETEIMERHEYFAKKAYDEIFCL